MKPGIVSARLTVGLLLSVSVGCSLLGPLAPDEGPYGFDAPTVPPESANPLPIEIAKDIEAITEDGVIYYQNPPIPVEGAVQPPPPQNLNTQIDPEAGLEVPEDPVLGDSQGPLSRKVSNVSQGPLGAAKKLRITRRVYKGGKTVTYVVQKGDTLMEIAFDKHGDYLRWRQIYNDNRKKMTHWRKMKVGTVLDIHNVKYVYIRKEGKPYLIRKGDTLKTIAQKLYGSPLQWKKLWKNNPQLIRNPKRIYAGFTLYYEDMKGKKPTLKPAPQLREPSQAPLSPNDGKTRLPQNIDPEIVPTPVFQKAPEDKTSLEILEEELGQDL